MKGNYFFHQKSIVTWNMVGTCFKAEKNKDGAILSMECGTNDAVQVILLNQLFKVDEFLDWLEENDDVELKLQGVIDDDVPIVTNLNVKQTTQTTKYYA